MLRSRLVFAVLLAARSAIVTAQPAPCDPRALRHAAETARFNIIAAVDGAGAIDAWRYVLDHGGTVAWTVTEYNVDARSTFVSCIRSQRAEGVRGFGVRPHDGWN